MQSVTFRATRLFYTSIFISLISLMALPANADSSFRLSTGYEYSSGKYGQSVTTKIETIPITWNYLSGSWNLTLSVPYIRVTGNGVVIPGPGGPLASGNPGGGRGQFGGTASTTQTVTNSGLGDVLVSTGYVFYPANAFYEIAGKVKFGTADADKGLGTGKNDYYLQLDGVLGKGSVSPFFTLGYVITGDSTNYTYNDVPYGRLGLTFKTGPASNTGLSYDYRQATIEGGDDLRQASVFIGWNNAEQRYTTLSVLVGFTDSSPDYGVNLTFIRDF